MVKLELFSSNEDLRLIPIKSYSNQMKYSDFLKMLPVEQLKRELYLQ